MDHLAGLTAHIFKNISSLQEVEFWGGNLRTEVKLLSLTVFRNSDPSPLVTLNAIRNSCLTLGEYSSCYVAKSDSHNSRVRVLVAD